LKKIILSLFSIVLISGLLCAQAPTGKIYGTVSDEDGNPLPGVSVEATSRESPSRRLGRSDQPQVYR